jgi:fructose-1-phosphate kinase PfkB-like protein
VAVAAGLAAVMRPGTELCHQDDVERLLPQLRIEELATTG